jgi:peptidoglycan/LPS O-acetylase OafA/YrhL
MNPSTSPFNRNLTLTLKRLIEGAHRPLKRGRGKLAKRRPAPEFPALRRARAIMADKRVVANLQVCRALAALFVVYGHSLHDLETISTRAGFDPLGAGVNWGAGVDIFFVISGFIMVHVAGREFGAPGAPLRFFIRRLARIVPMYWLLTTVLILGAFVAPEMLNVPIGGLAHILKSYFFIPDWRPDMSAVRPVMALGWTLNYEMFFYVVFAFAMLAPLRAGIAAMSVFFVALAIIGSTLSIHQTQLAFWTDPISLEFLFGVYVALAYRAGWRLKAPVAITFAGVALLLIGANLPERLGLALDIHALRFGLPAALLIAAAALGPEMPDSAAKRFMVALGDASYALYLCHPFFIRPLREVWLEIGGAHAPLFLFSLTCMIGATAIAFALHYGVEGRIARALAPVVRRLSPGPGKPAAPTLELVIDRPPAAANSNITRAAARR